MCRLRRGLRGIIPACAGNRAPLSRAALRCRDHPRVRGEQWHPVCFCEVDEGSSPRARGTEGGVGYTASVNGIIPACAGNRSRGDRMPCCIGDHPRVRGEQSEASQQASNRQGSSPRARGTGTRPHRRPIRCGIIPACAGNRLNNQRRLLTQNDITFTFQEEETQLVTLPCLASAKFARISELAS